MEDNTITLFQQAKEAFEKKEFEKALKLFEQSVEKEKNQAASIYINKCKKILGQTNNNPPPTQSNTQDYVDPSSSSNTMNSEPNNSNTTNSGEEDKDKECLEYLKKKDYYDLLNVTREATEEDLKKSYRKLAVKFHPDKNKSSHAAEVFKKIGNAFKILSDKEKRQFYDKYGTEEEFREKYQQQYHHQEDEEIDPFDLFNMFFNGGNFQYRRGPGGRVYVHRRNEAAEENVQPQRPNRLYLLFQILPLLIFLISSLGQSFFKSVPVYSFIPNEYNDRLMTTQANGINYYVNDKFYDNYKTAKDIEELEYQIERDFLNFLNHQCVNAHKAKQELEYKLYYYRRTSYEPLIQRELNKIDFSVCNKLNELSQVNIV